MTATTGNPHNRRPADQVSMTYVLLRDELGRLILSRLRPWHRMLARCAAARLDRKLAAGASPETSASLAARATQLTSMKFRRDLAASVRRILAAAAEPPAVMPTGVVAGPPRLPLRRARISQLAGPLVELARHLAAPGPVPAQEVAMISRLLADGTGPLYREAYGDDLGDIIEQVTRTLAR